MCLCSSWYDWCLVLSLHYDHEMEWYFDICNNYISTHFAYEYKTLSCCIQEFAVELFHVRNRYFTKKIYFVNVSMAIQSHLHNKDEHIESHLVIIKNDTHAITLHMNSGLSLQVGSIFKHH